MMASRSSSSSGSMQQGQCAACHWRQKSLKQVTQSTVVHELCRLYMYTWTSLIYILIFYRAGNTGPAVTLAVTYFVLRQTYVMDALNIYISCRHFSPVRRPGPERIEKRGPNFYTFCYIPQNWRSWKRIIRKTTETWQLSCYPNKFNYASDVHIYIYICI